MNHYQGYLANLQKKAQEVIINRLKSSNYVINLLPPPRLYLIIGETKYQLAEISRDEETGKLLFTLLKKENESVIYIEGRDLNLYDLMKIADHLTENYL